MSGRIRTIKPELLEDEKASALSDAAWRLFVSSWLLADDYGRFRAGARYLAAQVWQDTGRAKDAERALAELVLAGRVKVYQVGGDTYAELPTWERHQRVDNRGKPRVPPPSNDSNTLASVSPRTAETRGGIRETPPGGVESAALPPTSGMDLRNGPPTVGASDPERARRGETPKPPEPDPPMPPEPLPPSGTEQLLAALAGLPAVARAAQTAPGGPALALRRAAETLAGLAEASGKAIPWVVTACGEAAADLAMEHPTGASWREVSKRLRTYASRAKRPIVEAPEPGAKPKARAPTRAEVEQRIADAERDTSTMSPAASAYAPPVELPPPGPRRMPYRARPGGIPDPGAPGDEQPVRVNVAALFGGLGRPP